MCEPVHRRLPPLEYTVAAQLQAAAGADVAIQEQGLERMEAPGVAARMLSRQWKQRFLYPTLVGQSPYNADGQQSRVRDLQFFIEVYT